MECKRQDMCQPSAYCPDQKQQQQHEGVEEDDEKEEDVEEGAIDDDRDDEEDEEDEGQEDEDDEDDDRGEQEQQNYEQDFDRVGVAGNLSSNGVPSLALCLVSPVASQQQLLLLPQAGRILEGPQQVGSDMKPGIRADWTEPATRALLEAWGERYVLVNKGNLKQEHWEEVAVVVNSISNVQKTDVQCKNRLDTLKKKYKVEKQKHSAIGSGDSKWPYYKQLDKLLSATAKQAGIPGAVDAGQPVKSSAVRSLRGKRFRGVKKFGVDGPAGPPNNASTCSRSKESPDMTDSSPQNALGINGPQSGIRKRKSIDTHFKTLAKAITKFGEIYEKMEQSKQQQLMDLEKIRMEFTRDLELQRMQLFMQTQVELAKMKYGGNDIEATISNLSG